MQSNSSGLHSGKMVDFHDGNSLLENAKVIRAASGKNGRVIKVAVVGVIDIAINQRMLVATPSANRLGGP